MLGRLPAGHVELGQTVRYGGLGAMRGSPSAGGASRAFRLRRKIIAPSGTENEMIQGPYSCAVADALKS